MLGELWCITFLSEGGLMKNLILIATLCLLSWISVHAAIKEETFHELIRRVGFLYPKTENHEEITVKQLWTPHEEQDSATRLPFLTMENPVVTLTGRLAQSSQINENAFMILVCHEFGHHLAKGPRIGLRKLENWSAAEGEADYWATS